MAEVQESGPLLGEILTDELWRALFGAEPGIFGDTNGSAFNLTRPPASDTAEVGSASIDSTLGVGGFLLRIPAGTTQSLTIPASSNASIGRTDLIVARLNPTSYTATPGPVRLFRVAGVEGSASRPSFDDSPPGVEDFPLYAITRKQGQALTEATVVDLRIRTGPHLYVLPGVSLPQNVPLGSTADRDGITWSRELNSSGTSAWIQKVAARVVREGTAVRASNGEGFQTRDGSRLTRTGSTRFLNLVVGKTSSTWNPNPAEDGYIRVAKLWEQDEPIGPHPVALTGWGISVDGEHRATAGYIDSDGWVVWSWASTNTMFGPAGGDRTLILTGTWETE